MEFLDNSVLPQSSEHIQLLHYMLILILILFIPFVSLLFGGTALSLYFKRTAVKKQDKNALRFSRQIMEIVTINKSVGVILGIVPLITAILIYAQLLHTSELTNLNYLAVSLVLFITSLVLIYSYRYSLSFNEIFDNIDFQTLKTAEINDDMTKLFDESSRISKKAGKYGLLFLFLALWFFIAAISIPTFYSNWQPAGFIEDLFNWKIIIRFIYYILAAFVLTGGMILFRFDEAGGIKKHLSQEYVDFAKRSTVRFTLTSAIILPVFMLINLLAIPGTSLSGSVFVYLIIALFLLFIGYHFLYLLHKKANSPLAALLFFVLLFSVGAYIISDQIVMSNSTKVQSAMLSADFENYISDLKGAGKIADISGEEIYKVRCESCHRFDQKLVGPPHNEVLPKYVGKQAQLVAYIRNPVKVDPAYPPMPNPGLKPREAEAVAEYLLTTYENKLK
jgi:cytochrome c